MTPAAKGPFSLLVLYMYAFWIDIKEQNDCDVCQDVT